MSEAMIRLEEVSKRYPGQQSYAVSPLSLEIMPGESVTFVGPSGCGKTTTLRMINRLVEPTSGKIWIDGKDVTHADPDQMRRHIGYVIQQIGLIPHMTVADNTAMVPRLLGWDRARITARVDEMLELVGLDPAQFRGRYPKQLSGGQQQRVGVARALAADPPVMLMDEPFGAVDPINRARLQDEFLALQARLKKTVAIVTHDIDEAIKLGDRIAIFGDCCSMEQYGTPQEILSAPANDYVRTFVGEGAQIRRLAVISIGDLDGSPVDEIPDGSLTVSAGDSAYTVLDRMMEAGTSKAYLRESKRVVTMDHLLMARAGTS